MSRRVAAVLVALVAFCASPVPAVHAQSSPFGPLPQPAAPTPTPEPVENPADQARIDRTLLFGIAGVVVLIFVGIGVFISRDARRNLNEADRRAVERGEAARPQTAKQRNDALKKKARAKTRAQKQARKKQRR